MTIIKATPQQLADAGAVIGRSALFDNRFGEADAGRAAAWAEALAPYAFDTADLLNAVTAHYRAEPLRMIMPADVIRLAREIRADRAQREPSESREAREALNDVRHGITPIDPQLGLPIRSADGTPVHGAYEVNSAIDRGCPTCGAVPTEPCVNKISGEPRKIPCSHRMKLPN